MSFKKNISVTLILGWFQELSPIYTKKGKKNILYSPSEMLKFVI